MDHHAQGSRHAFHVSGLLGKRLLAAFPELHAQTLQSVTALVGDLPDQGALLGVLSRIESLGLVLFEVGPGNSVRTRWAALGRGAP